MQLLKYVLLIVLGAASGAITAAGFFAVITAIGIINRVAAVTKTKKYLFLFEEIIILGAFAGTLLSVFEWKVIPDMRPDWTIVLQWAVLIIIGVVSGIYVGLFVVCLAETTKAMPIFIRRVRIAGGLGIVILMIGIGKAVGQLVYYFVLYGRG